MAYEILFQIHFGGGIPAFYTPANDITEYVKNASWNVGMRQPYQLVADDIGATIRLNNDDSRFSPENASGPYYGDLVPGIYFEISKKDGSSYSTLWLGFVDSINPAPGEYGSNDAVIKCVGIEKSLKGAEVRLPLLQDVSADQVIDYILDQVDVPGLGGLGWQLGVAGNSELGITTQLVGSSLFTYLQSDDYLFPYVGDNWDDQTNASRAIGDAVSGSRGRFFVSRTGAATFWNKDYLQKKTTVSATYDEDDWRDIDYYHGQDIANVVVVVVHPRTVSADSVLLWELDEPITIRKEGDKSIRARYSEQDSDAKVSALSTVLPTIAAGTLAYSYKDGSGTMVSADDGTDLLNLTFEGEARGAKLTLTNGHSDDIELSILQIYGKKITTYNDIEIEVRDGLSITQYGRKPIHIDAKLLADEDRGRQIAQFELGRRSSLRGMVKQIRLSNKPANDNAKIDLTMGNRITVQDSKTSHDADYFIIGEAHVLKLDGTHEVTWYLEPAAASQVWLLGVTGYSELGITTILGF